MLFNNLLIHKIKSQSNLKLFSINSLFICITLFIRIKFSNGIEAIMKCPLHIITEPDKIKKA